MALFLGLTSVAHAQQSTAPTVLSVAITSNPGSDGTYNTGDIITVNVTFSEAVTVERAPDASSYFGTPHVRLIIGTDTAYAYYSGDGSSAVVQPFSYTVQPLDRDADGVFLRANSLRLEDGTIRATDDSAAADLDHPAMAFPSHKVAAGGDLTVGLAQVGIQVVTSLRNAKRITSNEAWQWQLSATEDGAYSDIPAAEGGTSTQYTPSAGDLGKWLRVTVTYDDPTGTGWTAGGTQPVLSQPTLSNAGYAHWNFLSYGYPYPVPHLYAQRFTTGSHPRGYRLTEVRLALSLLPGDTAAGTWAVHADDAGKPAAGPVSAAVPILTTDLDDEFGTFEEFTHPDGVHLDPDTKYWIVISQTTPVADGSIGVDALSDYGDGVPLPLVEGFDPNSEDEDEEEREEEREFCTPPLGSEREELCTPPADVGSEEGWSINIPALTYHWDDPDDPSDDVDATYPPDHPSRPNELILDPALLPWQLFATGLQLPERDRFVLRMSLVAPPVVTVKFGASDYTVDEGGSVSVEVELSSDPKSTITIPITTMGEGGATSADYSVPTSVTFNRGETTKTVTFTPTQDTVDDDGESVKLAFGTMPHSGVSAVTPTETTVRITDDDDPEVTVMFGQATYTVDESDDTSTTGVTENTVEMTLTLSADPERTVVIPIETMELDGATGADYSVPSSVTFNAGETSKSFVFTATHDTVDDDGERVRLSFGALPDRVSPGTTEEVTLDITDDDDPEVTVTFGQSSYTVAEGGTQSVTVTLSADPERTLIIYVETTLQGGATPADYSGVPSSVTFTSGQTSAPFSFTAFDDTVDDDDESVKLGFGTMPDNRVSPGATDQVTLEITDDDHPEVQVQFGQGSQGVGEGETVNVTISLNADPERTVTIPITATSQGGATSSDYSVPASVTFNDGESEKTIAFMATADDEDDDDESVKLGFGSTLPARVSAGTRTETTLDIGDDDDPTVTVMFSQSTYTVAEGATQPVTVTLSADPERTIIIPIMPTLQGTATAADYSGVPPSVKFVSGDMSESFTFTATQDVIDDDTEGVKLSFGTMPDPRVSAGTPDALTLTITDDDTAEIVLSSTSLTVTEEDASGASYTVALATEPTVDVTVTISGQAGTDLSLEGIKLSNDALTFTPTNWNRPQTVTVKAAHDDDGVDETATLTHTASGGEYAALAKDLPVSLEDDDTAAIVVTPGVLEVEESKSESYTVRLDTEPTATVTVSISGQAGTDFSLSGTTLTSDSLTFTKTDWKIPQTLTVATVHDANSANETATLNHIGSGGDYAGLQKELPVTITDDDTGELRLVGGVMTTEDGRPCEGRLEIYYNGTWGTICDDYWTEDEADVACRQLGFAGGSVVDPSRFIAGSSRRTGYFPPGTGPIWLDDVQCTGNESGLLQCPSYRSGAAVTRCRHWEDVGLRCVKPNAPWISDVEIGVPPGGNGTYDTGETVEVTLVWSEAIELAIPANGQPPTMRVHYASPLTEWVAEYARGSGTDRTVFTYTVQDPTSIIHVVPDAVRERDGTFRSEATGIEANLAHGHYTSSRSGPGDTQVQAARIVSLPAFNNPGTDGSFGAGETVEVTLTFSRAVRADISGGLPTVRVKLGGAEERVAPYQRGEGTEQLVFAYTLADRDGMHSSLEVEANALSLNGSAIRDVAHAMNASIDHTAAAVMFLPEQDEIANAEVNPGQIEDETNSDTETDPASDNAVAPQLLSATVDGGTLTLTYNATLDNGVTLSSSAFAVNVDGASRTVVGAGAGQSSVLLLLSPAVESGDTVTVDYTAPDGNDAIQDTGGEKAASFSGRAVTNNTASSGIAKSDTVQPPGSLNVVRHESGQLLAAWSAPGSGATPTGYTVQWKESGTSWDDADDVSEANVKETPHVITGLTDGVEYAVRVVARKGDAAGDPSGEVTATPQETVAPSPSAATVDGATLTITFDEPLDTGETPENSAFAVTVAGNSRGVDAVALSGSAVTLTLASAVSAGEVATVDYTVPTGESTNKLQDTSGNAAASFSGQAATNNTQAADPLTASVSAVPGSQSGEFTFELRFSETPRKKFSYKIMRDHAFTVTGGQVTGARRLVPRSNVEWEIHVQPDGDGTVTIVLPVTTDCTAEGAICTQDGRKLSNSLNLTVPGPGS